MNPTQLVQKQKIEYWQGRTNQDLANPNRESDPRERNDIKCRLDPNLGDVIPPFYAPGCCYPDSGSIIYPVPPAPVLTVISGSAILHWTYDGIITPTSFLIQKSLNGSLFNDLTILEGTFFTYTDYDVISSTNGSTYWYKMRAVDNYGTSSFSNIASITFGLPPAGIPNITSSLSGSAPSGIPILLLSISGSAPTGISILSLILSGSKPIGIPVISLSLSGSVPAGIPIISVEVSGSIPPSPITSSCKNSVFPPQLFTSSLQTNLSYDLV